MSFDLITSVLAILVGTLLLWALLSHQARRAARRFNDLLFAHSRTNSGDTEREIASARRRLTTLRLLINGAHYAIAIGALLMILRRVGVPLDSLVLPVGFIGAGLGLGAQNLVRDVVAGLFIVFEGQLAVGDVVSVDGKSGTVQEVGLRVTHLRTSAGHDFYFPNGTINVVDKHPRRNAILTVRFPLADAAKTDEARKFLLVALQEFDRDFAAFVRDATRLNDKNSNVAIPQNTQNRQAPAEEISTHQATPNRENTNLSAPNPDAEIADLTNVNTPNSASQSADAALSNAPISATENLQVSNSRVTTPHPQIDDASASNPDLSTSQNPAPSSEIRVVSDEDRVLDTPPNPSANASASAPEKPRGIAIYARIEVKPQSLTLVQTRLAARLSSAMAAQNLQKSADAEVEIFEAPALSS